VPKRRKMPVLDSLIKRATGHETTNFKLHQATEVMLRRILEGLGLNIQADTTAKQIENQMVLADIAIRHIVDEPGKPPDKLIPSGYYFYKKRKLAHILFEPFMENGEVIIKQGHPTVVR
jgi:hypothetical protein